jgi:hypothetical protein
MERRAVIGESVDHARSVAWLDPTIALAAA